MPESETPITLADRAANAALDAAVDAVEAEGREVSHCLVFVNVRSDDLAERNASMAGTGDEQMDGADLIAAALAQCVAAAKELGLDLRVASVPNMGAQG